LIAQWTDKDLDAIESSTQQIGRHIFAHLADSQPNILQRRWWDDRIMAWAMRDESVKVQMFRLLDVLPMLGSSESLTRHVHEYFDDVAKFLPAAARLGLSLATARSLAGRTLAVAVRRNALAHARRFIAGTNAAEVLAAALHERELKRAFTLDILGEAVASEAEADSYLQAYLDLIRDVAPTVNGWPEVSQIDRDGGGKLPRVNVSVKLSALDSQFDPIDPVGTTERVGRRLRLLLRAAREARAFVNVDMESYKVKDLTLAIFQQILAEDEFRGTPHVGIVIQAYLKDAEADLRGLADWSRRRGTPAWVRLVKGAYWDYETVLARSQGWPVPVFERKWETDANYETLTRFLLTHHTYLHPALGSHNIRSLAHGLAVAQHLGVPKTNFELQMLYGMGDPEKQVLVDMGYRMRIYMPYGELIPGMAYLVRRLLENTSNDSFLRASFAEHISPETLLMNPIDQGGRPSPAPVAAPRRESQTTMASEPFCNEPLADFAKEENRRAMLAALAKVRSEFGQYYPLWIGNQPTETNGQLTSINPSDKDQVVGIVAAGTKEDAARAVAAARSALPAWSARPVEERAEFLHRAADLMRKRRWELSAWEVYECGKEWREADGDVCEAIDFCEFYAREAVRMQSERGVDVPGEENRFLYLPRGVAVIIAPWNFPLAILTGMSAAALATGNTVVMKPAEQSSVVAAKLLDIFQEVELPPGVLNYLPGAGETVGAALVEHPDTAVIAFTGSRSVGLAINARAAETSGRGANPLVKRVIAEMGGKNAIIIDDDADLDEAVLGVVKSAFGYQGQKCSACSRVIVLATVYDQFLTRLAEATRSLKVGPADDPSTSVGPVIDNEAFERIRKYVAIGRQEGRALLCVEAGPLAQRGFYIGPHIFADIGPESRLAQEEIFGPVLAVLRAGDLDEAIRIANGTDYALTGGIFSRSPAHLDRAQREMLVGNLYLNRPITGALVARQPFGGFKMSGIGSQAGGVDYLLQFVVPRTVTENTMRRGFAPPIGTES
jgi:RHH-type proline utilization regulon transcriptional repressor/proline dehydrogenase/delta 1-pyrroline-5-carboxylate dehydrogenase